MNKDDFWRAWLDEEQAVKGLSNDDLEARRNLLAKVATKAEKELEAILAVQAERNPEQHRENVERLQRDRAAFAELQAKAETVVPEPDSEN